MAMFRIWAILVTVALFASAHQIDENPILAPRQANDFASLFPTALAEPTSGAVSAIQAASAVASRVESAESAAESRAAAAESRVASVAAEAASRAAAAAASLPALPSRPAFAPQTSSNASFKKEIPIGPIAGGVVAGLLVLGALMVFLCRARRRRRNFAPTDREKILAAEAPHPLPIDSTSSEGTPAPSGERRLSPPTQVVPQGILVAEKEMHHTARIEQEIRTLTEQAEARGLSESTPTGQTDHANTQLLEEVRMLRTQMSVIQQQQMQMQAVMDEGLPEYTPDPT
ncbi:hypothetical protein B0H19DRAFT_1085275 [Mycena capillaripes]|nr:hypothetical protein B0H19DRAFT_1085275 [Mycena capillaripes]